MGTLHENPVTRMSRKTVVRRADASTTVSGAVEIGPFAERTIDAHFYEGGIAGRSVGDTLYSRSGLYLIDQPDVRVGTKATMGVSSRRSNGNEFVADLLELVTFVDGSSIRCRGVANLSAFERRDGEIELEVGEGTGSMWGWNGTQVTSRTDGPPSQSRRSTFRLACDSIDAAGSGPIRLPPARFDDAVRRCEERWTLDVWRAGALARVTIDPASGDQATDEYDAALYLIGDETSGGDAKVLVSRLSADMLPTGSSGARLGKVAGFRVLPTRYGLGRGAVRLSDGDTVSTDSVVAVRVPQAGGPEMWQPLTDGAWVGWGVDRGLLELAPCGLIGRIADLDVI